MYILVKQYADTLNFYSTDLFYHIMHSISHFYVNPMSALLSSPVVDVKGVGRLKKIILYPVEIILHHKIFHGWE